MGLTSQRGAPATLALGADKRQGVIVKTRPTPEQTATFASRLKFLREKRGLSQNRLGALAGVSDGFISRLERAVRGKRPGWLVVRRLAEALNASENWLADGASADGRILNEDSGSGEYAIQLDVVRRIEQLEKKLLEQAPPDSEHGRIRPPPGRNRPSK